MLHVLVLCLLLLLTACEPCAVVIGGHCQDRQQQDDSDKGSVEPEDHQPQPLAPWVAPRGNRG